MPSKTYETDFDALGNIRCWCWQARDVSPFDWVLEMNALCKNKFPNAEIYKITKNLNLNDQNTALWTIYFAPHGIGNTNKGNK